MSDRKPTLADLEKRVAQLEHDARTIRGMIVARDHDVAVAEDFAARARQQTVVLSATVARMQVRDEEAAKHRYDEHAKSRRASR